MQFCNLNEAFPDIPDEEIYKINSFVTPQTIPAPQIETFAQIQEQPQQIQQQKLQVQQPEISVCPECQHRKKYGSINSTFNEVLNVLLLVMLLYIIIYKPNIRS